MRIRRKGDTKACADNSRLVAQWQHDGIVAPVRLPQGRYTQRNTNAARGRPPQTPAPPAARAGLHQLVARKGGTHVGLGLPGPRGGARRGWVARPPFPFPLTHTHLFSTT